ncbi:MAG TPA: alpha/beta fold hydrolase, partial [Polyangiaceae bacterium LLY-WYZ-15_(1-7)]|nr:alpha/beta fold hydrolase [Polyangiaceae bacterium LLY-WYZ-15_(1-7)]
ARRGAGPTLLALHGTGSSSRSFCALAATLGARFTVVAPDLPGHAGSRIDRRFRLSLPSIAAALGELIEALAVQPALVLAHSAGAAVAARAMLDGALRPALFVGLGAALTPLEGLARLGARPAAAMLARSPITRRVARRAGGALVGPILRSVGSTVGPEATQRYRELARDPAHVGAVFSMLAQWDLDGLHAALPRLDVPTLLLGGARDGATPIAQQRALARRLPAARAHVVLGAGHLLHEERPAEIARLVEAEWNRLDGGRVKNA